MVGIWIQGCCCPYDDIATAGDHREGLIRVSGITWYTNLKIQKRSESIDFVCTYSDEEYPRYEDVDAIDVSDSGAVPMDYAGQMGVPITFLNYFNPEQFEIVSCCEPCIRLSVLRKKLRSINRGRGCAMACYAKRSIIE